MRLRTILARSMPEGMRRVREQLGNDAIILSSEETEGGVLITAAADSERAPVRLYAAPPPPQRPAEPDFWEDVAEALSEALDHHRAPGTVCAELLAVAETWDGADRCGALAAALAARFAFRPFAAEESARPLLFVGPPGAGKTVTVAKLAAASVLAGRSPAVICADLLRAGGVEQLATFTATLRLDLLRAATPADLADARIAAGVCSPVLIDGPAIDPRDPPDAKLLRDLAAAAGAEPVLVLPAGLDAAEAAELAEAARGLGIERFVATRLDAARRLGGLLASAAAGLAFAGFGVSRQIAGGLRAAGPESLAHVLLATCPA